MDNINQITIGVDLGGTNTALGIVDSNGNILAEDKFPNGGFATVDEWADHLVNRLDRIVDDLGIGCRISGIGIGAPCANSITGTIDGATDLPWPSPIPLAEMLKARTGLPTTVGNDANAAAIGEMTYGAARGLKNFIVLTLGTGVGSGIVVDGHLLTGSRGFAGELGHVTFPFAADRPCGCGRNGCLQTVASAKGVVLTATRMLAESNEDSVMRDIPPEELTARHVWLAATVGDEMAERVFEFTGECLGRAAAEYAAMTDPDAIILFGGVANAGDLLLAPMRRAFKEHSLFLYRDHTRLLLSTLPDSSAAILGGAALHYM